MNKCTEIKNGKFIMAATKIKDLLKCIVNSEALSQLFTEVTADFDYLNAKRKYLVACNDGVVTKRYVALPDNVGQRLAFIFCLLVEIDQDCLNFNGFLLDYFNEDGSYYASYHAFCDIIICSLENMISDIYASDLQSEQVEVNNVVKNGGDFSAIKIYLNAEREFISTLELSSEEKAVGVNILNELEHAFIVNDAKLVEALACGYNYFILYNNVVSESVAALMQIVGEFLSNYEA